MQKLYVKFAVNKKLNTVRILCAYNVYKNTEGDYVFPAQRACAYVTGDLVNDQDVKQTLARISAKYNATLVATN